MGTVKAVEQRQNFKRCRVSDTVENVFTLAACVDSAFAAQNAQLLRQRRLQDTQKIFPDFQEGDADALYKSVHEKLFSLPDDTLVYPAHDYKGRRVSSVTQEKKRNPRLGQGRTLEQFRDIMAKLNLPYPKFINYAVPGNQQCGICPDHLPENLEKYCGHMTESPQG